MTTKDQDPIVTIAIQRVARGYCAEFTWPPGVDVTDRTVSVTAPTLAHLADDVRDILAEEEVES